MSLTGHQRALTITDGALCMDGGSVFLEAIDSEGKRWEISFDWSIAAQRAGNTSLRVNGSKLKPAGPEEAEWIESLRGAEITGAELPAQAPPSPPKRIVLAPDAKAYLDAIDKGPRFALATLRDDLLQKLQSPQHRQQTPPSTASPRSGPLPLP